MVWSEWLVLRIRAICYGDRGLKWHTEFGYLNRGDMLTSESARWFCSANYWAGNTTLRQPVPQFCVSPVDELKMGEDELANNPLYQIRYQQFVSPMVYGERKITWDEAYSRFRSLALAILNAWYAAFVFIWNSDKHREALKYRLIIQFVDFSENRAEYTCEYTKWFWLWNHIYFNELSFKEQSSLHINRRQRTSFFVPEIRATQIFSAVFSN